MFRSSTIVYIILLSGTANFWNLQYHANCFTNFPSSSKDANPSLSRWTNEKGISFSRQNKIKKRFVDSLLLSSENEQENPSIKRRRVRKKRKDANEKKSIEGLISDELSEGNVSLEKGEKTTGNNIPSTTRELNDEQILADIAAFKKVASVKEEPEEGVIDKAKDIFSTILVIDFFVVLGLLLWFVVGVFSKYALSDTTIINSFRSNFDLVVQPAIGVLMMGTLAGGAMSKLNEAERSDES